MIYSRIVSTGTYLPEKVLTNDELALKVDTSNEWIVERTGITSRHIASPDESASVLGAKAAKIALERAGISKEEIDLIIVATCTPDNIFPSTACLIQQALEIPPCAAFDIQAACSGFVYGLSVVDQFIKSGMAKKALLIGSEVMSKVVDWQDRRTCILFGDGAGAVVLEASEKPGVYSTYISADGREKDILGLANTVGSTIQMQGNSVFKLAVNMLDNVASETLKKNNLSIEDLHWLVPHQANVRIIQATAEKLKLPMEKVILTLPTHGNTSSASIPLALDVGIQSGRIQRDQNILLEAFGGGLTWGTALIRY